ncbi:transcriptional regulator (plasmid) [Rhizobium grahamii]|uniref:Transcriptional regulator n=1 Tax=Rhizobium grahamii TaxID=1120045 RepID=A0A5Q0CDT5_9HYPH|nr:MULTISPECIES: winged helix-turn-helix domain-containing protein [Rhizobium]QFY63512.1 transcriptional regulator [Rhizobium grahamii]QRM51725.1 transcriptional regulator [Rhizobium sp. BG6]
MATAAVGENTRIRFGPFKLAVSERMLTREGIRVELGGRALEILIALVSSPNEIISKKELMDRVWPDAIVEEGSLRFHMAGLRKALGDGHDGARYIATLAGRGYCFVAPTEQALSDDNDTGAPNGSFPHANLPQRLGRMVGRDVDVMKLGAQLTGSRLVTIVGPGGVGKTTVAIAAAHQAAEAFAGHVLFVDLGVISDPKLAATTIAAMLGLPVQAEDATPDVIRFLRDKHLLLILDTCEHLVEAIATIASSILDAAPQVHIVATSREALRINDERIYRLDALACPPEATAAIQEYPAVQLFVERAIAGGAQLEGNEAEASIVADICRKLDGVALAIELAARRVETYGLEQTAALLDQRLTHLWQGLRTAPPRHQTLQATLDWSYGLLSDTERAVLRRLAVFVGNFPLDAALDVVADETLERASVFAAIDSLVEKSMVAARPIGAMMRYRLLDTTRAYVVELSEEDEREELARRHAAYCRLWFDQNGSEWTSLSTPMERAPHFNAINNVRSALEWCFGGKGDVSLGVRLVASVAPVFRAMGLLPECQRWTERALQSLDDTTRGGIEEMQLQAAFGVSVMFMKGHNEVSSSALNRSLEIAQARGDQLNAARLHGPIHFFHLRSGEFRRCLDYAERCSAIASQLDNPAASTLSKALLGLSYCLIGRLEEAHATLAPVVGPGLLAASKQMHYGFDHYTWARIGWSTNLWLQGNVDQARAVIRQCFKDAETMRHPVSFAISLSSIATLLWIGDLDVAEEHLIPFIARAETQAFGPYLSMGQAYQAEIAIRRGQAAAGVTALREQLEVLHGQRFELFTVRFQFVTIMGLLALGRFADAWMLSEESEQLIEAQGYYSYLPELLRLKGQILSTAPELSALGSEAYLRKSLDLSRSQGAGAWELRAATDLARLWVGQRRTAEAVGLLRPVYERLTEGRDTAVFRAAAELLARA